jgi:hypothetical protein
LVVGCVVYVVDAPQRARIAGRRKSMPYEAQDEGKGKDEVEGHAFEKPAEQPVEAHPEDDDVEGHAFEKPFEKPFE